MALKCLSGGIPLSPLPPRPLSRDDSVAHAPVRTPNLSKAETNLAVQNALRYFPPELHPTLVDEFVEELNLYGHIYMYRFRAKSFSMRAHPIDDYPAKSQQAASVMLMIMNNLDPAVAQFPHELVTYGGNGQIFCNWAQFWLVMYYLARMGEDQTLSLYSGHPMGLFPSHANAPRVVITNGMVIPNYSSREKYEKMFALGVSMYGQMTAGSYCYIGPQGIVHGTTITVMNAGRKYLGVDSLKGKVFVTAGLGGMSGAQAKAAVIAGCVGVIAEMSEEALQKRFRQGWLKEIAIDLDDVISRIRQRRVQGVATSIGYHGNVVSLWERLVIEWERTGDLLVELASDQTSCHNPFGGGYYPVQISFEEANDLLVADPDGFKDVVEESLRRHAAAINFLAPKGMFFWDYGNAFLLEAQRAGADVFDPEDTLGTKFKYPSYVQDIMGDIFSMGFGPFRWVCTSCDPQDLKTSDSIAAQILEGIVNGGVPEITKQCYQDNITWIKEAGEHDMVVGSQARILYADQRGRVEIALAFNSAIASGKIKKPIVISRDHHDVSGTDSPFRETSNIYDGSAFCADMAVQNCIGDAARGATWVALHNGGGVGWGEVINGGFGLLLDGSNEAADRARTMLNWDVSNGVARRAWSGNTSAISTIQTTMQQNPRLEVTVPHQVSNPNMIENSVHRSKFL